MGQPSKVPGWLCADALLKMFVGTRGRLHDPGSITIPGGSGWKAAKSLTLVGGIGARCTLAARGGGFFGADWPRHSPARMIEHCRDPSTGFLGGLGIRGEENTELAGVLAEEPGTPGLERVAPRVTPSAFTEVEIPTHSPPVREAWEQASNHTAVPVATPLKLNTRASTPLASID